MDIERVGVVGIGQMGAGIAEVVARAGLSVVAWDRDAAAVEAGQAWIDRSLDKGVDRGKLTDAEAAAARRQMDFSIDLEDLAPCALVIEAVVESEPIKADLLQRLDGVLDTEAIIASNTSSIPIVRLGAASGRPDRVIGLHFFNPPPVMELVEVIPSLTTSQATIEAVESFAGTIGKVVVRAPDRAGFIVNAILLPMVVDAARMVDRGLARAEDVDKALTLGAGFPMGPLGLADYVGIDTVVAVADVLFEEFKEPQFAVPPLMRRMVEAGHLGRKTGRGFYAYD